MLLLLKVIIHSLMPAITVFHRSCKIYLGILAALLIFPAGAGAQTHLDDHSSRAIIVLPTDDTSRSWRADEIIDRGRAEHWGADDLLAHLELDEIPRCQHFRDPVFLRERFARWREAVTLLGKLDRQILDDWLLGLKPPPAAVTAEVDAQLDCLVADLIAASHFGAFDVRLFPRITDHFGGRVRDAAHLADLIEEHPGWLARARRAITRSAFRNMNSQGFIWYRKFRFTGRNFNRVSPQAAQRCGLLAGQTWKPEHPTHQRCWHRTLSAPEREQEILVASAAPGLSRHHWGTDVDILGLNPHLFTDTGALFEDWRWLDAHALDHGFFQPYRGAHAQNPAHMEERWHWSYYPISQALWESIRADPERFEHALFEQWERLERRWGRGHGPFFEHMRQNWRAYLFHIDLPLAFHEERSP